MQALQKQPSHAPTEAIARIMAIVASFGCLVSSVLLAKVTPIFGELFKSLEVQLPLATRFLVTHNLWISLLFVGIAITLPIGIYLLIPDSRRRLIIAGSACAASTASVAGVVIVLYLPLVELARKVSQLR